MGYIKHHSIIITSESSDSIREVQDKAISIFGQSVSNIVPSKMNGYESFFIAPDGSKEGWKDSEIGDEKRNKFLKWIDKENNASYVELFYGEDNGYSDVRRHN